MSKRSAINLVLDAQRKADEKKRQQAKGIVDSGEPRVAGSSGPDRHVEDDSERDRRRR